MLISLLKVLATSVVSIIVLFFLTKIMGRKQMSELSMFDYIIGISIGSIAAEMATNIEEYEKPLVAMIVYAVIALIISIADSKFFKTQKVVSGLPLIIYEDGRIYEEALNKSKMGVNDLLSQARLQGYFNLSELKLAVLEPNGKISFLPLACSRPLNPQDMNMTPSQEDMPVSVIIDGKIIDNNLSDSSIDRKTLMKALETQKIKSIGDIILATCDSDGNVSVYSR